MNLQSDEPIRTEQQDRLGRVRFAQSVASRLMSYAPSESLVVGLAGPWGSGKSSLLNLVSKELAEAPEAVTVLNFTPWRYGDDEALLTNFFGLLARTLKSTGKGKGIKKAASLLKRTGDVLALGKPLDAVLPGLGAMVAGAGKAAGVVSSALEDRANALGSLDAIHEQLAEVLKSAKQRLIVIIDELDRLDPAEIRQVFRLVKTLADFPYIIYVLAYDKSVIYRAIDSELKIAAQYLEKIVAVPLDLPAIDQNALDNLVLGEILELIKAQPTKYFDEERLFRGYINGFRPYFRTLRDVRRFLNVLTFAYGEIHGDVDIGDLAALTALQVFEPTLYERIRENPGAFIDTVETILRGDKDDSAGNKERVELLLVGDEVIRKDSAIATLRQLFPKVEYAYRGMNYAISDNPARGSKRISSAEAFPRFFQLRVGPDQVSDAQFDELLSLARSSPASFVASFDDDQGRERARYFVNALLSHDFHSMDEKTKTRIVASLFELSEHLPEEVAGMAIMPFDWLIGFAVDRIIDDLDVDEWTGALTDAIALTVGVGAASAHVDRIIRTRESDPTTVYNRLLDQHVSALKDAICKAVLASVKNGRLGENSMLARTAELLQTWDFPTEFELVLNTVEKSPLLLAKLVYSARIIQGFQGYIQPRPSKFNIAPLHRIIEPGTLRSLLSKSSEDRSILSDETLARAVKDYLQIDLPAEPSNTM